MLKGDEASCNNLAKTAFYPPIYSACVTMAIGCVLLLTMVLVEKKTKDQNGSKAKKAAETPEGAEVDKLICCVREARELEGNYDLLHRAEGGVRMLIGTSFTLLSSPKERHAAAKYIYGKEMKIHISFHSLNWNVIIWSFAHQRPVNVVQIHSIISLPGFTPQCMLQHMFDALKLSHQVQVIIMIHVIKPIPQLLNLFLSL